MRSGSLVWVRTEVTKGMLNSEKQEGLTKL
jgi:hypothetical protein